MYNSLNHYLNQIVIACSGVVALILVRLLESLAGINWDYHPDARTYIESVHDWKAIIWDYPMMVLNNGFYVYVNALQNKIYLVIFFNYIFFIITNFILYNITCRFITNKVSTLALFLFLFNPYRLHLANFVLKDTLIIFVLCYVAYKYIASERLDFVGIFFSLSLRLASFIYFYPLVNRSRIYVFWAFCGILLFSYFVNFEDLLNTLSSLFSGDIRARSFDTVPTFQQYGVFAPIFRALTWPFFILTGAFLIFSVSGPLVVIAFSSLSCCLFWVSVSSLRTYVFATFIPLAIFAMLVPGFVSYQRYVLPVLIGVAIFTLKRHAVRT